MFGTNPLGGGQPLGFTNSDQMARTAVRVKVQTPRPTAQQLAAAVFTTLQISERDRAAMRQANGGKDVRDSLAADFHKNGINHTPLRYIGGGKYAGEVGMPEEMHHRLIEWAKTDGDAPADTPPDAATKRGEVQAQGAYTKHKAELALRKQEAKQQLAQAVLGKDGVQMAAGTVMALPKPTIPPAVVATGGALATAVVVDKLLELSIERQMGAVRNAPPLSMSKAQDEPPPTTTAEKPQAPPEIKVGPEETSLARVTPQTPTASQPKSTPPAPQQGKPQGTPDALPPAPNGDLLKKAAEVGTGVATTATGITASKMMQPSRTEPSLQPDPARKPRGLPEKEIKNPSTPKKIRQAEDIQLQNKSAVLLSRVGYDVEHRHNRPITAEEATADPRLKQGRRPDFEIEGRIFDHFAPERGTSVRNMVMRSLKREKIDAGQATRFVVSLDRSDVTLDEMRNQLKNWKVDGLDEVIIVKDGEVIPFYPFED